MFFFFKQKTAYDMRISDWSSDVCSSDLVGDVGALELTTRVNGTILQEMKYDDLIFDFANIVSYISSFTELHPGDVVVTGTAAGVAGFRKPATWLVPGDVCEIEVKGIGTLRNRVAEAQGQDRGPITRDDPQAALAEVMASLPE